MVNILTRFFFFFILIKGESFSQNIQFSTLTLRDGAELRLAYAKPTAPVKGTILFLQGMGSFIERHSATINTLTEHGFEVWTFDWRGQGASTRQTKIASLCHIDRFSTYIADLREVMQKISPNQPVILFANSMGGHVALRYAHDNPSRVSKMVLMAPMFDIKTRKYPKVLAHTLARSITTLTGGERFVFGDTPFDPTTCLDKYKSHIHGEKPEYEKTCQLLTENPQLATGGVSFGWLNAAFRSNKLIQQDKYLETISVSTLIMTAEDEHIVENKIQGKACAKMQKCRQVIYPKARHNLLAEAPELQKKIMTDFFEFIE